MQRQDTSLELQGKPTLAVMPKRKRKPKQEPSTLVDIKRKSNMSQEEENLATHVALCSERYKGIEDKFHDIERRLTKVEADLSAIKSTVQSGFSDIKLLLEKQNNARFMQMTATFGTIAAAIIGVIGYIITH